MLSAVQDPAITEIKDRLFDEKQVRLFIKREDLLHPLVSGNKWRKLKYNLVQAAAEGHDTLLTFGGAYSNHIYATAAAAKECGFRSIGVIRGEAHDPLNQTLQFATEQSMQLHYMDRTTYRNKNDEIVLRELQDRFGRFYLLPEGGTNTLAVKGCVEMINDEERKYNYICVPVGTGGTLAGIITGMAGAGSIIGYAALKGDFLTTEVNNILTKYATNRWSNWEVQPHYHFGGYAKIKQKLIDFINSFEATHRIPLDQVYTGKMIYGIYDMIMKNKFPARSNILAIHTGGLQGRSTLLH